MTVPPLTDQVLQDTSSKRALDEALRIARGGRQSRPHRLQLPDASFRRSARRRSSSDDWALSRPASLAACRGWIMRTATGARAVSDSPPPPGAASPHGVNGQPARAARASELSARPEGMHAAVEGVAQHVDRGAQRDLVHARASQYSGGAEAGVVMVVLRLGRSAGQAAGVAGTWHRLRVSRRRPPPSPSKCRLVGGLEEPAGVAGLSALFASGRTFRHLGLGRCGHRLELFLGLRARCGRTLESNQPDALAIFRHGGDLFGTTPTSQSNRGGALFRSGGAARP